MNEREVNALLSEMSNLKSTIEALSMHTGFQSPSISPPGSLSGDGEVSESTEDLDVQSNPQGSADRGITSLLLSPEQRRIRLLEAKIEADAREMSRIQQKIATIQEKAITAIGRSDDARKMAEVELERLRRIRTKERATLACSMLKVGKGNNQPSVTFAQFKSMEEHVRSLKRALQKRDEEVDILVKKIEAVSGEFGHGQRGSPPGTRRVSWTSPVDLNSRNNVTDLKSQQPQSSTYSSPDMDMSMSSSSFNMKTQSSSPKSSNRRSSAPDRMIFGMGVSGMKGKTDSGNVGSRRVSLTDRLKEPSVRQSVSDVLRIHASSSSSSPTATDQDPKSRSIRGGRRKRIFIDVGSHHLRVGLWHGDKMKGIEKLFECPTVLAIGHPDSNVREKQVNDSGLIRDESNDGVLKTFIDEGYIAGDDAYTYGLNKPLRSYVTLVYPAKRLAICDGDVTKEEEESINQNYLLKLLFYFNETVLSKTKGILGHDPEAVVLHNGYMPTRVLETCLEYLFETMNCTHVGFLDLPSYLTMSKIGSASDGVHNSALIIDIGAHITRLQPVMESVLLVDKTMTINFGGESVTKNLLQMIHKDIKKDDVEKALYHIRDAKEKHGFVSETHSNDMKKSDIDRIQYEMSFDDEIMEVSLHDNRYNCIEELIISISRAVIDVAMKLPIGQREYICRHIIITGGTAQFDGLANRLHKLLEMQLEMIDIDCLKIHIAKDIYMNSGNKFGPEVWRSIGSRTSSVNKEEYFAISAAAISGIAASTGI
jgi:hypothetical protein